MQKKPWEQKAAKRNTKTENKTANQDACGNKTGWKNRIEV